LGRRVAQLAKKLDVSSDILHTHKLVVNHFFFATFAFAALNFAHRSFVALEILALAAADITRFFL
jgi:hypothetical protein